MRRAVAKPSFSVNEFRINFKRKIWAFLVRTRPGAIIPVRLTGTRRKIYVRMGDEVGRQIFLTGGCDPAISCLILRFLKPGMVFFDVGANIGQFTILAADRLNNDGIVFSFEPSPREFAMLESTVSLNRLSNVKLYSSAVGSTNSREKLKVFSGKYGAFNTLGAPSHSKVQNESYSEVEVECVTLDSIVKQARLDHVDLMKIDVEGGEVDVLRGASSLMQMEESPVVICEVGDETLAGYGETGKSLRGIFSEFAYDLYEVDSTGSLVCVAPEQDRYAANYVALKVSHFDRFEIRRPSTLTNAEDQRGSFAKPLGQG